MLRSLLIRRFDSRCSSIISSVFLFPFPRYIPKPRLYSSLPEESESDSTGLLENSILSSLSPEKWLCLKQWHNVLQTRIQQYEATDYNCNKQSDTYHQHLIRMQTAAALWDHREELDKNLKEAKLMKTDFTSPEDQQDLTTAIEATLREQQDVEMQLIHAIVNTPLSQTVKHNDSVKQNTDLESLMLELDECDVHMEFSSGAGGLEAMLFVQDLFLMYQRFVTQRRPQWTCQVVDEIGADLDGLRFARLLISGQRVFSQLKFEGGVHRVQRIPKTSPQGKIHTSTVSVAVLPLPKKSSGELKPQDVKVEQFRASGPGGQGVNKSESGIRCIHVPSGLVATSQDYRTQHENKEKAWERLKLRVQQSEMLKQLEFLQSRRKLQVGNRDRSEKIRTYNYPQGRITDHRLKRSWKKLHEVMNGQSGDTLDEMLLALNKMDLMERLCEYLDNEMPHLSTTTS